jgi:LysM repeat protein
MTLLLTPILAATALAADPVVVVKSGDTLTSLSKRHGIAISRLVDLNDLADPNRIYAGQKLRVAPAATPAPPTAPAERSHTVRSGEHLIGIARRYGVTVGALVAANGIANASRIYAGQRLAIPGGATSAPTAGAKAPATPAAPPAARSHTVSAGEYLIAIARHYGVSVAAIVTTNGLANASRIYAGQRLAIPAAAGAAAPSASSPAAPAMPSSMAQLVARRDGVRRIIVEEATRQGVPPAFALAVAWQESGWQQAVVSHAGAIGVMQLMPDTARWIGDVMLGQPVDARDTRANISAGVRLLRHYLDRYDGDRALVLAAYYQGQRAVDRHGIYPVSRPYIASITALVKLFGG